MVVETNHPSTRVGLNPVITSTWCPMETANAGEESLEVLIGKNSEKGIVKSKCARSTRISAALGRTVRSA